MPATADDFKAFLNKIQLDDPHQRACNEAHQDMRERLQATSLVKDILITTFLQGSVKRKTCIAPKNGEASDVDLVVATRLSESEVAPLRAWERFADFLRDNYGSGPRQRWKAQGRSVCVAYAGRPGLPDIDLDLVITSAPSEAVEGLLLNPDADPEDDPLIEVGGIEGSVRKADSADGLWKVEPLRIPDRENQVWEDTHPLNQIRWTAGKNAKTNGIYTQTVMAIKWWQRCEDSVVRPKGFTLEAIVGACCPNGVTTLEEAIVRTFKEILSRYAEHAMRGRVPVLPDVGTKLDVLKRITPDEFLSFYEAVGVAATLAEQARLAPSRADACKAWRRLFGDAFPMYVEPGGGGGGGGPFVSTGTRPQPKPERFA